MHDTTPSAILVATDMSPRADRALARAMDLAAAFGARLTVLHVVDEDLPRPVRETVCREAERLLLEQVAALPAADRVTWAVEVTPGVDVAAIVGRAEATGAGLIVLGTHREQPFRGVVFGTTAERVMRSGHCPVLVAKGAYRGPYRHVLAAVNGSQAAARALHAAARCWPEAAVQAVHVVDVPTAVEARGGASGYMEAARAAVQPVVAAAGTATGRRPELLIEEGEPAGTLCRLARRYAADLVAVGSAELSRPMRALLGSTADRLLHDAPCDVLVVPPA